MKLMMASELGSTGAVEMFSFQRLSGGNGTKPFREAPIPVDMVLQFWADEPMGRIVTARRKTRIVRILETPGGSAKDVKLTITLSRDGRVVGCSMRRVIGKMWGRGAATFDCAEDGLARATVETTQTSSGSVGVFTL